MENYIESFGAIKSPYDVRDYVGVAGVDVTEYPKEFELKMGKIKNQGSVSSCVAHSLAEIIEYFNRIQEGSDITMSVGYIYGNREYTEYKGRGYYLRDALKVVTKCGDAPYDLFPYNLEVPQIIDKFNERNKLMDIKARQNKITSYYRLNNNNDIKYNLMHNGPVLFSIEWYKNSRVIDNKLIFNSQESTGCHCMVIYGWNKDGWKFMNSWGKSFGKDGCAILPYNNKICEAWGVVDNNINGDNINIIKPTQVKVSFAKIINYVMRLFK